MNFNIKRENRLQVSHELHEANVHAECYSHAISFGEFDVFDNDPSSNLKLEQQHP